jgi:hypothetical protein
VKVVLLVSLMVTALSSVVPSVPAQQLGYLPEMLGEWDIMYPGPDTMIRRDYRERLELRADGTYVWSPAPVWAVPTGRWGVFRSQDGVLRLCFETKAGDLRCQVLVLIDIPGSGWTFHWQRTRGDAVVFADRIFMASRSKPP